MLRLFPIFSLMLCALATLPSCTKSGTAVIQDKQEFTIEDQRVIGDHLVQSIKRDPIKYDVLNANAYAPVYDYLSTMLQTAVITEQVVMREDFHWEIIPIINHEDAYAYSMPGGKIVLSTAMLQYLEHESELLALLSSEIYFADVDLHTATLKDKFSGIRLGSIVLGSDTKNPSDLIDFLREQSFTEEEVAESDRRTISVMCPFNYDVTSLKGLVDRTKSTKTGVEMTAWNSKRPRPANWQEMFSTEEAKCDNASSEKFRSRYESIKSQLPQ